MIGVINPVAIETDLSIYNSLTDNQKFILVYSGDDTINNIADYIIDYHEEEDFMFVAEVLDVMDEETIEFTYDINDYPGKDEGMPFEWWKDKQYMIDNIKITSDAGVEETPNAKELLLFAIYSEKAVFHIQNALTALDRASDLVSTGVYTNLHNGKADAFRHAFWNALDDAELGTGITKLFTDAHEWHSNNHQLETEMDFFNNDIGRDIGEPHSFVASDDVIESEVKNAITDGELKYLAPLAQDGSIISTTTIRYTDQ